MTYSLFHRIDQGEESVENFLDSLVLQTGFCMLAVKSYTPEFFLSTFLLKLRSLGFPGGNHGTRSGVPLINLRLEFSQSKQGRR